MEDKMNINEVVRILADENYSKDLIINKDELKEKMAYPEDDYYQIKKDKDKWKFYHINNEKGKDVKLLGEYDSEEEACLYFLLNRLDSYYLDKYILPAKRENNFNAKKDVLNEKDLELALSKIGIDQSYVSYTKKQKNSIYIFEESDGWHTKYIDSDGGEYLKTIAQKKSRCISIAFVQIYSIYLLDKLINNCIRKGYLKKAISTNYIIYFLGSK